MFIVSVSVTGETRGKENISHGGLANTFFSKNQTANFVLKFQHAPKRNLNFACFFSEMFEMLTTVEGEGMAKILGRCSHCTC